MNKIVYLNLLILKINKLITHEFWYDYVKAKYNKKAKSCNMDADSFIFYIKTEDVYIAIAKHVEIRFNTSYYELERQLPREKNKKVFRLMNIELNRKIMTEFAALRLKAYSYLTDDVDGSKKKQKAQKCVLIRKN